MKLNNDEITCDVVTNFDELIQLGELIESKKYIPTGKALLIHFFSLIPGRKSIRIFNNTFKLVKAIHTVMHLYRFIAIFKYEITNKVRLKIAISHDPKFKVDEEYETTLTITE